MLRCNPQSWFSVWQLAFKVFQPVLNVELRDSTLFSGMITTAFLGIFGLRREADAEGPKSKLIFVHAVTLLRISKPVFEVTMFSVAARLSCSLDSGEISRKAVRYTDEKVFVLCYGKGVTHFSPRAIILFTIA